ncbi:hypothetical protein L208DRAFT_1380228 [Tricholoma matsutake]|nr:hypothetical protein L208DRAFT_1380228 [Tricholoma matsutake 945]
MSTALLRSMAVGWHHCALLGSSASMSAVGRRCAQNGRWLWSLGSALTFGLGLGLGLGLRVRSMIEASFQSSDSEWSAAHAADIGLLYNTLGVKTGAAASWLVDNGIPGAMAGSQASSEGSPVPAVIRVQTWVLSAIQDSLQWDLEQAADHANLLHMVFLHRLHFDPVGSGNGGAGCTDRDGAGECSDPSAQASVNVEDAGAGDNITGSIGVNGTGDWRGTAGRASGHDRCGWSRARWSKASEPSQIIFKVEWLKLEGRIERWEVIFSWWDNRGTTR